MKELPSLEDWKDDFRPIKADEVSRAVKEDSSWNPAQTGMGRLWEMELYDTLERVSEEYEVESIVEVGASEGLTTLEMSMVLPDSEITGIDIDERALERARENRDTLEEYAEFLQHVDEGLSDGDSFRETLEDFDYDQLSFDGVENMEKFADDPSYAFFYMVDWKDLPEPVDYVSRGIADTENWQDALHEEVSYLSGLQDIDFRNSGALQMSDTVQGDLVVAPNSIGTLDNTAVFSKLSDIKQENSELYDQAVEATRERDDLWIEDTISDTTEAAKELFMEQFLEETEQVTGGNGALLLADGRQYLELEIQDGEWYAVEGRGAVSERQAGMCTTYDEKLAEDLYDSWLSLDMVDTTDYTEKFIGKDGEIEILYEN